MPALREAMTSTIDSAAVRQRAAWSSRQPGRPFTVAQALPRRRRQAVTPSAKPRRLSIIERAGLPVRGRSASAPSATDGILRSMTRCAGRRPALTVARDVAAPATPATAAEMGTRCVDASTPAAQTPLLDGVSSAETFAATRRIRPSCRGARSRLMRGPALRRPRARPRTMATAPAPTGDRSARGDTPDVRRLAPTASRRRTGELPAVADHRRSDQRPRRAMTSPPSTPLRRRRRSAISPG